MKYKKLKSLRSSSGRPNLKQGVQSMRKMKINWEHQSSQLSWWLYPMWFFLVEKKLSLILYIRKFVLLPLFQVTLQEVLKYYIKNFLIISRISSICICHGSFAYFPSDVLLKQVSFINSTINKPTLYLSWFQHHAKF